MKTKEKSTNKNKTELIAYTRQKKKREKRKSSKCEEKQKTKKEVENDKTEKINKTRQRSGKGISFLEIRLVLCAGS